MSTKKLKKTKKPLKIKPAVVPKDTKKLKTRKKKRSPITGLEERKLRKRNIFFSIIFGTLLIVSIVFENILGSLFYINPDDTLTQTILGVISSVLVGVFIYLTLLSFETYKITRRKKLMFLVVPLIVVDIASIIVLITLGSEEPNVALINGIIAGVLTPLIIILLVFVYPKYHTRHNIWRIIFVGATIFSLFMTFFGAYILNPNVVFRDSLNGADPDKNPIDTSLLSAPFVIDLVIDIDSLLDLLDDLDNPDIDLESSVANITAAPGASLGNYLYRWDIYDSYNPDGWEFEKTNEAALYDLPVSSQGQPNDYDSNVDTRMEVQQTIYSATSGVDISLLTTWNSEIDPHIIVQSDWGSTVTDIYNNPIESESDVLYNEDRDQLRFQSTVEKEDPLEPFQGTFTYETFFMSEDDINRLVTNTSKYSLLDTGGSARAYVDSNYGMFLSAPANYYDSTSTSVTAFADDDIKGSFTPDTSVYDAITNVIQSVLLKGDAASIFSASGGDDTGEDPANILARAEQGEDPGVDASAYISLAVMTLRRLGIPARPVLGFAVGDGDDSSRAITVGNMYYWIETLLPIDENQDDTVDEYVWGQFQVGPYPVDESTFVYCENSLNAEYDLDMQVYESTPGDIAEKSVSGQTVYLLDYSVDYTIEVTATRAGNPATNIPISLKTYTTSQVEGGFSTSLLSQGEVLTEPPLLTDSVTGIATTTYAFNTSYLEYDSTNPGSTSYFLIAQNGLTNIASKGFIIFPNGYLDPVETNASAQTILDPFDPGNFREFYLMQKGYEYEMSVQLFKDDTRAEPLVNRNVTFYLLTRSQLLQIQGGTDPNPDDFTEIGVGETNSSGIATHLNPGFFEALTVDETYGLVALYGLNYSFTLVMIVDGLSGVITVSENSLDTGVDGTTKDTDITVTITMTPPGGVAEPQVGENVGLWIVYAPDDTGNDWKPYDESSPSAYWDSLNASSRSQYIGNYTTDANGQIFETYTLNASILGAGVFKIVCFFVDRWNGSEDIFITVGPAAFAVDSSTVSSDVILPEFQRIFLFHAKTCDYFLFLISSAIAITYTIIRQHHKNRKKVRY